MIKINRRKLYWRFVIWKLTYYFLEFISNFFSYIWKIELAVKGVKLASSTKIFGRPIVNFNPYSKIYIGENTKIESRVYNDLAAALYSKTRMVTFFDSAEINIGMNVELNGASLTCRSTKIFISDNCKIGPNCIFMDSPFHSILPPDKRSFYPGTHLDKPIFLGKNVWLGINVTVMPGVNIGENSVIGAGSIVTVDIPSNSVAVGIPAKVVRSFSEIKVTE